MDLSFHGNMDLSFHGKVALITGAGAGIGLASARAFAEAGAAVALADIDEEAARAAAEGLVAEGHKAIGLRCDVTDEAAVEAMVQKKVSAFGRLDAAFNNAGIHVVRADTANGVSAIPKSVHPNIDIFDFALSDAEMAAVDALDAGLRNGPDPDVFDLAFLKARQAGRK